MIHCYLANAEGPKQRSKVLQIKTVLESWQVWTMPKWQILAQVPINPCGLDVHFAKISLHMSTCYAVQRSPLDLDLRKHRSNWKGLDSAHNCRPYVIGFRIVLCTWNLKKCELALFRDCRWHIRAPSDATTLRIWEIRRLNNDYWEA